MRRRMNTNSRRRKKMYKNYYYYYCYGRVECENRVDNFILQKTQRENKPESHEYTDETKHCINNMYENDCVEIKKTAEDTNGAM